MVKINRRYEEAVNTFGYFFDKLDIEVILTDEFLRIEWLNRPGRRLFKKTDHYLYKQWHFHLMKEQEEPCNICQDILTTPGAYVKSLDVVRDDKKKILQALIFPLNLPLWDTKKHLIILIDITDKEKANREMAAMQTIMTEALKKSGDAFFIIDNKNQIQTWNTGAELIFGFREDEIIGTPVNKIIPMDSFDTFNVEQNAIGDKNIHRIKKIETNGIDKSGKQIALDLTRTEVLNREKMIQTVSFFVKDVSPKKAIQKQLKHIIQQFYKLNVLNEHLNRSLDLHEIIRIILLAVTAESGLGFDRAFLLMMDDEDKIIRGKYAFIPAAQKESTGLKEILDQTDFFEIMLRTHQGEFNHDSLTDNKMLAKIKINTEDPDHIVNFILQRRKSLLFKNGRAVDPGAFESGKGFQQLSKSLKNDSFVLVPLIGRKKIIGVLIADQGISRREIHLEDVEILKAFATQASLAYENAALYMASQQQVEALGKAYDQLREQQEKVIRFQKLATLGEMSAKIAHEIRNPLVSMGGLAKAIADKNDKKSKTHKFAKTIYKNALNLEDILENLLNLAMPRPLKKEEIKLRPLIKEVVKTMKAGKPDAGCEFLIDIPEEETVFADAVRIRQVFTNLIRNALQAIEKDGKIEVFIQKIDKTKSLEIHFRDNGPGIEEANVKKLFEPFYTTKTDGSGLGLSISSQIMNQHGGEIFITRGIQQGADIILVFPPEKG